MEPAIDPHTLTIELMADDIEDAYVKLHKRITEVLPKEAQYVINFFDSESRMFNVLEVNVVVHYWWDVLDGKVQNV